MFKHCIDFRYRVNPEIEKKGYLSKYNLGDHMIGHMIKSPKQLDAITTLPFRVSSAIW